MEETTTPTLDAPGNLVDIDTADGAACLVHAYSGRQFAGAGVTTLVPVLPPPPK